MRIEDHFHGATDLEDQVFGWAVAVQSAPRLVYRSHNDAHAKVSLEAARIKFKEACAKYADPPKKKRSRFRHPRINLHLSGT